MQPLNIVGPRGIRARTITAPVAILVSLGACRDMRGAVSGESLSARAAADSGTRGLTAATSSRDTTTMMPSPHRPRAGELPGLIIGRTTIWLDSTSMATVGAALGMGAIVGDTAGHDPLMTACYSAGSGPERVTVRIRAFGFVDSDATKHETMAAITARRAMITRGADQTARSRYVGPCPAIPVPPSGVRWWNGLRLGMSRVEAESLLGPPAKSDDGDWVYRYDDPHLKTRRVDPATGRSEEGSLSVTYGFQVRYQDGVITRIEAWYITEPN